MLYGPCVNSDPIFTIRCVYGDRKSTTLAVTRAVMVEKMKNKSTRSIPPDLDSHDFKEKRENQANILINSDKPDHPLLPSIMVGLWKMESVNR